MSLVREPSDYKTACSQIRNSNEVFVPMLRQRSNRFRHRLITRSDDGYFGRNPARLRLRPSSPLAPREDSRIAADLDCHSEAPKNHEVVDNSAFFSRSEKATFENPKLDSMSQVSDPNESKALPTFCILSFKPKIENAQLQNLRVGLTLQGVF
jgi:hypothetical protein